MESMITNPVPTRAEVSDVANAVMDGTDAVMLSAESAVGRYPFETIRTMAEICRAAEQSYDPPITQRIEEIPADRIDQSVACSAIFTAQQLHARAVVAFTHTGTTAFQLSRYGTNLPIHALTPTVEIQRKMALYRGVRPAVLDTNKDRATSLEEAEVYMLQRRHLKSGDLYVITSGSAFGNTGYTDSMQVKRAK